MRVKLRLRAGAGQMRIGVSRFLKRGTRGFTLVELLAVLWPSSEFCPEWSLEP